MTTKKHAFPATATTMMKTMKTTTAQAWRDRISDCVNKTDNGIFELMWLPHSSNNLASTRYHHGTAAPAPPSSASKNENTTRRTKKQNL